MRFKIRKGLDIPIPGAPEQAVAEGPRVASVALLGADYRGVRPDLLVGEGERVRLGQTLFTDRKRPEVRFAAPAGGIVVAINRGRRRALTSIVIRRDEAEEGEEAAPAVPRDRLAVLGGDAIAERLLVSGLWTAFRTRPYGKVPEPGSRPGCRPRQYRRAPSFIARLRNQAAANVTFSHPSSRGRPRVPTP